MRLALIVVLAISAAACSPAPDKKAEAPAAPVAAGPPPAVMSPGLWRTTVTITAMSVPGVPPSAVEGMKTRPFSSEECITSNDLSAYLDKRSANNPDNPKNCTRTATDFGGGRINVDSVCTDASGHASTVRMSGTYTAERVDMVVKVDGEGARGPQSQTMSLLAERTGACPG